MDNMHQDLEDLEDNLYTQEFNLQVTNTDQSNQEDNSFLTLTNTEHASIEKNI